MNEYISYFFDIPYDTIPICIPPCCIFFASEKRWSPNWLWCLVLLRNRYKPWRPVLPTYGCPKWRSSWGDGWLKPWDLWSKMELTADFFHMSTFKEFCPVKVWFVFSILLCMQSIFYIPLQIFQVKTPAVYLLFVSCVFHLPYDTQSQENFCWKLTVGKRCAGTMISSKSKVCAFLGEELGCVFWWWFRCFRGISKV